MLKCSFIHLKHSNKNSDLYRRYIGVMHKGYLKIKILTFSHFLGFFGNLMKFSPIENVFQRKMHIALFCWKQPTELDEILCERESFTFC